MEPGNQPMRVAEWVLEAAKERRRERGSMLAYVFVRGALGANSPSNDHSMLLKAVELSKGMVKVETYEMRLSSLKSVISR